MNSDDECATPIKCYKSDEPFHSVGPFIPDDEFISEYDMTFGEMSPTSKNECLVAKSNYSEPRQFIPDDEFILEYDMTFGEMSPMSKRECLRPRYLKVAVTVFRIYWAMLELDVYKYCDLSVNKNVVLKEWVDEFERITNTPIGDHIELFNSLKRGPKLLDRRLS